MSLSLMYRDELKGFYKSKVMLFLWVGLPVLSLWIYLSSPDSEQEIPMSVLAALIVSSIAGALASIILTVGIIHEKSKGVYPLFLIRPIKRRDILLGKFFAVFTCIVTASAFSISLGLVVDLIVLGSISAEMAGSMLSSILTGMAMMAISASAGILIGMISSSVLVGVILVLYVGNQISSLVMIPAFVGISSSALITLIPAAVFSVFFLFLAIKIFNRKQF